MSEIVGSGIRFSRAVLRRKPDPDAPERPFTFKQPMRTAAKPVFLGQRHPGTLMRRTAVSKQWIIVTDR